MHTNTVTQLLEVEANREKIKTISSSKLKTSVMMMPIQWNSSSKFGKISLNLDYVLHHEIIKINWKKNCSFACIEMFGRRSRWAFSESYDSIEWQETIMFVHFSKAFNATTSRNVPFRSKWQHSKQWKNILQFYSDAVRSSCGEQWNQMTALRFRIK